ncbi:expressed unknown protein [Seminavis robusta]|uniref:Transmembrane protein n=1 Tax=Seminavis robusta TaxID=568900 RepID=A0A9N8ELQ7_9STRA|nr:expressed unknown protein [Seminavis robusta]|eukprot:Sro1415_g270720.1 n/a (489) ;mRNA; f:10313-11779
MAKQSTRKPSKRKLATLASEISPPPDVEEGMPVEEHQDEPEDEATKGLTAEERRERDEIVPYLLQHAYHLPGNNLMQDWWQYQTNNHPVFGICLHHKYHPLSWKIRAISLFGSMLFGLAMTSIVYCAFVFVDQDSDQALLQVTANFTVGNSDLDSAISQVSVTTGNLVLWFLGAPIHGLYDSFAWLLAGCACIQFTHADSKAANICRKSGAFLTTLIVIVIMAVTSFAVMLRAALDSSNTTIEFDFSPLFNDTNGTNYTSPIMAEFLEELGINATGNFTDGDAPIMAASDVPNILESHILVQEQLESLYKDQNFEDYLFVVSYFVELVLTYIIYYPIFGTIMFSGILSKCCGCYPSLLGGRPYEMKQLELAKQLDEEGMEKGDVEVEYQKSPDNDTEEPKQSTKPKKPKSQSSTKTNATAKSKTKAVNNAKAASDTKPGVVTRASTNKKDPSSTTTNNPKYSTSTTKKKSNNTKASTKKPKASTKSID